MCGGNVHIAHTGGICCSIQFGGQSQNTVGIGWFVGIHV